MMKKRLSKHGPEKSLNKQTSIAYRKQKAKQTCSTQNKQNKTKLKEGKNLISTVIAF